MRDFVIAIIANAFFSVLLFYFGKIRGGVKTMKGNEQKRFRFFMYGGCVISLSGFVLAIIYACAYEAILINRYIVPIALILVIFFAGYFLGTATGIADRIFRGIPASNVKCPDADQGGNSSNDD